LLDAALKTINGTGNPSCQFVDFFVQIFKPLTDGRRTPRNHVRYKLGNLMLFGKAFKKNLVKMQKV